MVCLILLQEMILELLAVFSGVIRGAVMPLSLNPSQPNFRDYHVWPEVSLDQITPWLPQVITLSLYLSHTHTHINMYRCVRSIWQKRKKCSGLSWIRRKHMPELKRISDNPDFFVVYYYKSIKVHLCCDPCVVFMFQVLRHVRGCYSTLLTLDLPNDALDVIKDLIFDLR